MNTQDIHPIDSREEFREVLRELVSCLRNHLDVPGVSPFSPEDLQKWFHSITEEDIRSVWSEGSTRK